MAQVLFQIGNPGGDAHLVNDPGFIAEAVLGFFAQNPDRSVVINRFEITDEEFEAILARMGQAVDAGEAEMIVRKTGARDEVTR